MANTSKVIVFMIQISKVLLLVTSHFSRDEFQYIHCKTENGNQVCEQLNLIKVCSETFMKCYDIHTSLTTWDQASVTCGQCNKMLVAIESDEELIFLNNFLREHRRNISFTSEYEDLEDINFRSHVGVRQIKNRYGRNTFVRPDSVPVTYFSWKVGHPSFWKNCTRTEFQDQVTRTLSSEDCTTDLALFFVCQSPYADIKTLKQETTVCGERPVVDSDIVFIIERVSTQLFSTLINVVSGIVTHLKIGQRDSRVALIIFQDDAVVHLTFDDVQTHENILDKISSVEEMNTSTDNKSNINTHKALEIASRVLFPQSNARMGAPRVAILLGQNDGSQTNYVKQQANILKSLGVTLLAVIVGSNNSLVHDTYEQIVSEPVSETFITLSETKESILPKLTIKLVMKLANLRRNTNTCERTGWVWDLISHTDSVNTTYSGTPCQHWDYLTLEAEHNLLSRFPGVSIPYEALNYCQDPDSSGIFWCYTVNGTSLWEPCFLHLSGNVVDNMTNSSTETSSNNTSVFRCNNSQVIPLTQLCDGIFHCDDFSDETACKIKGHNLLDKELRNYFMTRPRRLIVMGYFQCGSEEWIKLLAKCNGVIDCIDASDEIDCAEVTKEFIEKTFSCSDCPQCNSTSSTRTVDDLAEFKPCTEYEFQCDNKQCIPLGKHCDGTLNCFDSSDEKNCVACQSSDFHCDNGTCLNDRLRCDKYQDCVDGTDEKGCVFEFEYLPSCKDWWEHGYHDSGNHRIGNNQTDGIDVYCDFSSLRGTRQIEMLIHNVSIDTETQRMFVKSSTDQFVTFNMNFFQDLFAEKTRTCFLEIKTECLVEVMDELTNTSTNVLNQCQCTVERFKAVDTSGIFVFLKNSSHHCNGTQIPGNMTRDLLNVTNNGTISVYNSSIGDSYLLKLNPQRIRCSYEMIKKIKWCVYNLDSRGLLYTNRSASHLQNCGVFKCPENMVKCPGSYCVPVHLVCDGQHHCPNGEEEIGCTCEDTSREVLFLLEDKPDNSESEFAVNDLARQFHTNDSYIRLLYFTTHIPFPEIEIDNRLVTIREQKYDVPSWQQSQPTKNFKFKSMARNLFSRIQFNTNKQKAVIFIENSLESSKVAELMFSNISSPDYMVYRVKQNTNFSIVHNKPDAYRFVKDIEVRKWVDLYGLGYKRFPQICQGTTAISCINGYRCKSSTKCILLDFLCDYYIDCPFEDDERICDLFCPRGCICEGHVINCRGAGSRFRGFTQLSLNTVIADLSQNPGLKDSLKTTNYVLPYLEKLNISHSKINGISKEGLAYFSRLQCFDLSYNMIKELPDDVFINLGKLTYLNLDGNLDLETISPTAFHGVKSLRNLRIIGTKLKRIFAFTFANLDFQSIDISYNELTEIEDYAFNGSSIKHIDFRGNRILNFNKFMFEGVSMLQELQTPAFGFCCMRPCYLSENKCWPPKNEFSSCSDLMRHPILQAVLWIVGLTALFGNAGSIFYRLVYDRERLKIGHGIFVTNLAGADLLMGIYLLMIAVVDSVYRNRYIFFDEEWRNSGWCTLAGILSTVSSEASVLFVCLITLDRLLVIKYPFGNKKFDPFKAHVCCIASWFLSFLIAIIPVIYTDYFEQRFYSRSAVCIALPLTRDKPPGWMYSVSIFVGLNFCTFIIVAFGQLSIFLELRKATTGMMKTQKSRRRDLQVARNLIIVATTDFMCWFPIGVMGIMALNGYPISGDVYAWTAVFILPLNSALNPILYTVSAIVGRKSFNPNVEEQSRTELSRETGSVLMQHQNLMKSIRMRGRVARSEQSIEKWMQSDEPIPIITILAIVLQLTKYMRLLHDSSISINDLTSATTFVSVNRRKNYQVSIVLDSKITSLSDEKLLQNNIYQLGVLIRGLVGHCRKGQNGQ